MNRLVSTALGLCVAALMFAGLSQAQQRDITSFHLNFAVNAAGTVLPAGNYLVSELHTSGGVPILLIQSDHANIIVPVTRVYNPFNERSEKTQLVLDRQGDEYRLAQVQMGERAYHYEVPGN